MTANGYRQRCLAACLLAAVALAHAGELSAQAATAAPLTLLGDTEVRTVPLSGCQTATPSPNNKEPSTWAQAVDEGRCYSMPNSGKLVAIGQVLLAAQNANAFPVSIRLKYVGEDGHVTQLTYCSTPVQVYEAPSSTKRCGPLVHRPTRISVGAHTIATLPLRFALKSEESLQALHGAVYVVDSDHTLVVPVTAAVDGLANVQFEPSTIHLSTNSWGAPRARHFPGVLHGPSANGVLTSGASRSTTVSLIGPGVKDVLARQPPSPRKILLHDDQGDIAELELEGFKSVGDQTGTSDPLQAIATLRLVNHPHPGSYSGRFVPSELAFDAPVLNIQIDAHLPAWFAVVCVFLGVILAMIVAPLAVLRRRAAELHKALDHAVDRYRLAADNLDEGLSWDDVLWNLNDVATRSNVDTVGAVSMAEALSRKIAGERDGEDLDEDRKEVLEVTTHLARWLRIAPAALRLHQTAANGSAIRTSRTASDSLLLQRALKSEPKDVPAADDLVARVLHQAWWHRIYYKAHAAAARKNKTQQGKKLKAELTALDRDLEKPDALTRTFQEQCGLDARLLEISQQLKVELEPDFPELPVHPPADRTAALTVNWAASPNLFSGWSTLDKAGFRDLRVETEHRHRPTLEKPTSAEWLWSLFFTLVTSIAYALTIYNSTWGSLEDILTALTAGFAGAVTLKIALPIFESQRLRQPALSSSP